MKSRKLTLLYFALVSMLVIGAVVVSIVSAPPKLKLKVKWKPPDYLLDNPVPDPWNAEIYFAPPQDLSQIDPATLRLEGLYEPESDPYMSPSGRLVVPFDGYDVLSALLLKVGHMAPGAEFRVDLEITGEFYDGTQFAGEGGVNLLIPEIPPP